MVVVALGIVGCGDDCSRPLSDYCSGDACPTLEETAAEPGWYVDEIRACGDTQAVVGERTFETGWVRYFDDSGALVAAEYFQWNYDDRCRSTLYGPVPSCPEEQSWRRWGVGAQP